MKDVSIDTKELQDGINTGEDEIVKRDILIAKLKKENLRLKEKVTEQAQAIKTCSIETQFDYLIPSIDNLNGVTDVQIAEKTLFLVHGDASHQLNWKQYGLRIGVSKGTLSSSSDIAEISVFALIGGDFVFPENTKLVSGVYAVSVSEPLLQPLRLEIQHCVRLTREAQTKYLKFAIAPVNTPSLPYQFSSVDGGQFTIGSWYGSIYHKEFSLFGIIGQMYLEDIPPVYLNVMEENCSPTEEEEEEEQVVDEEESDSSSSSDSSVVKSKDTSVRESASSGSNKQATGDKIITLHDATKDIIGLKESTGVVEAMRYVGLVFCEEKRNLSTFTAAKDLDLLIEYIEKKHSQADIGPDIRFTFKKMNGAIELKFDAIQPETATDPNWIVRPYVEPSKVDIDKFGAGETYSAMPPRCLISVTCLSTAVHPLHYPVLLDGIVEPVKFFIHRELRAASEPPGTYDDQSFTTRQEQATLTNPGEVLRIHSYDLSNALGASANFRRVTNQLYAGALISLALVDDVTTTSSYSAFDKGNIIVMELCRIIQTSRKPGNILIRICDILIKQEDSQLKEIGLRMKR